MCKLGDIIVVNNYIGEDGMVIGKHSFIVVNDKPDFIEGLGYDLVTNVMSSFKNEEQRNRKLRFMENIEIISDDIISNKNINKKSGFVKADQLIYFDKSKNRLLCFRSHKWWVIRRTNNDNYDTC